MLSFYRRFIKNYNAIAHPLINLTKGHPVGNGKKIVVKANEDCQITLDKLKEILRQKVCLKYPNFKEKFIVTTDASLKGLGGQLGQLDKQGHMRPLGFVSRPLEVSET